MRFHTDQADLLRSTPAPRRGRRAPVLAALAALWAMACLPAAAAELNIIQPNIRGMIVWPIHVGEMLGYFEEEGVTLNLVASDATVPFVVFLSSGDADLALLNSTEMFHAVGAGFDVASVYTVHRGVPQGVYVADASPIFGVGQLTGHRVALATNQDLSTLQIAIAHEQGTAETVDDIDTIIVGDSGPIMTSVFLRGVADAFVGPVTSTTALAVQGIAVRDVAPPAAGNAPINSYVMMRERIDELRDPVCGFLRAWSKGIYIGQQDIEIIAAMSRHPDGVPEPWETPDFGYRFLYSVADLLIPPKATTFGTADPAAWQAIQDDLLLIGEIDQANDVYAFLSNTFDGCANDFDRAEVMAEAHAWMSDPANAPYVRHPY